VRRKSLFVSIILILGLGIIINNFANAQECSCEKNNKGKMKVQCPGDAKPVCSEDANFIYPKCRKDDTGNFESRCCKKREDGTFKCHKKDESGNKIIFQVKYQAGSVDNSGNSNEGDDVVLTLDDDDISDQSPATAAITATPEVAPEPNNDPEISFIEAPNVGSNAGSAPPP